MAELTPSKSASSKAEATVYSGHVEKKIDGHGEQTDTVDKSADGCYNAASRDLQDHVEPQGDTKVETGVGVPSGQEVRQVEAPREMAAVGKPFKRRCEELEANKLPFIPGQQQKKVKLEPKNKANPFL